MSMEASDRPYFSTKRREPRPGSGDIGLNHLLEAFADRLAVKMLEVAGGPGAYRDPDVLALAIRRIDPELPRRVAASEWWQAAVTQKL